MKVSELWLREWINPALTRAQLSERLTMAGLEVESLTPVAEEFSGVVIAQVMQIQKHPEADRLQICVVDVGRAELLSIACGATNVKVGMKVAAALEGAVLANNLKITTHAIRGVTSQGMLCSARELGLAEDGEGLFELPPQAPLGEKVWDYLKLTDYIVDVSITPNRGDCLSIKGLAKEIAALTQAKLTPPAITSIKPKLKDSLPVTIQIPTDCPRYAGRILRQVKADALTPIWMQERLRRSGIRCISPVVDIMNYVMLEVGQPMHAFDLAQIAKGIVVRQAKTGESLQLLTGAVVELIPDTLIIADDTKPLAIAGVMGGLESAVTLNTQDIFLESAFFSPLCIAQAARQYGLSSESSYRFERGIDPTLQIHALERATALLLDIVGGQPGPLVEVTHNNLLQPTTIALRKNRITQLLGLPLADKECETILRSLDFQCKKTNAGWNVVVPPPRSDVTLEVDLIEEIARLYGYDKFPCHPTVAALQLSPVPEDQLSARTVKQLLCARGYHEIITYSFIDKKLQTLFDSSAPLKELLNPMTADMSVMRASLWPGLVNALLYNQNRQQARVRFFEWGLRFILDEGVLLQQNMLSGLVSGSVFPEQWGVPLRAVDFFDVKSDIETICKLTLAASDFVFKPGVHPALHPGQTAELYRDQQRVGLLGALHPTLMQALDIQEPVFLFELLVEPLTRATLAHPQELSKFPEIRRDIAMVVKQAVSAAAIQEAIVQAAGELLKAVQIFDVYQGPGIAPHHKSIALALTWQHSSRTLVDEEVAELVERVIVVLRDRFAAELRG